MTLSNRQDYVIMLNVIIFQKWKYELRKVSRFSPSVKLIITERTETWIWERIFCQLTYSFHFLIFLLFIIWTRSFICFIEVITCCNVLKSHISYHCFKITSHLVWRSFTLFFCKTIHHWFWNSNISTFIRRKWFRNYHNYSVALVMTVTFSSRIKISERS